MLISLQWLQRYVDAPLDGARVADILTMAGFPVVSVEEQPSGDRRLDVEITSNRPDLQSYLGIAGEVAAALRCRVVVPSLSLPELDAAGIDIAVDAPDLCPLYTARVVRGLCVGPSPAWLVDHLEVAGQRAINNVVDVTNFVLLECGHPLHAFDLAKLRGGRLVARRAPGEVLTAIDGSRIEFHADDCAIADGVAPVALGGVMGGGETEVGDDTLDVVLECALFAPLSIRATSRRHQMRSESSFRFERFVDPARAAWASDRAASLLVELCGARAVGAINSAGPGAAPYTAQIDLRTEQVTRILGVTVTEDEIVAELSALGLEQVATDSVGVTAWAVQSSRPDLVEEIDLVEEVARRVGFDRVPAVVNIPVRPRAVAPRERALLRLRDTLVAAGLRECCTAPFVGEGPADISLIADVPALRVENPMRADESLLRRSVLGPLLRVVRGNQDRGVTHVRFFETAPVYLRPAGDTHTEEMLLTGGVISGGYSDVKGVLERLLTALGLDGRVSYERGAPRPLAMERSATLRLGDRLLGHIGELHDSDRRAFGIDHEISVLEVRADLLAEAARLDAEYRPVSRFPAVERDLAIVLADSVTWADVRSCAARVAGPLLASIRPFDVYRGDQIGRGRKSVALRLELRSADRTLTGDEAEACIAAVVDAVATDLGGVLRG